jgi:transcriptional regulator with XRE-family HTH domain
MRLLREKHGISIAELSGHCNVSPQRLSEIELGMYSDV